MSAARKLIYSCLRAAISIGLLVWLIWAVDVSETLRMLQACRWELLAAALLSIFLNRILTTWKWKGLLAAKGVRRPFWELLRIVWISNMFGRFLPAAAGADAVRMYSFGRTSGRPVESAASVMMERLCGFSSLAMMAIGAALWASFVWRQQQIAQIVVAPVAIFALTMLVLWNSRVRSLMGHLLERLPWAPGRAFLQKTYHSLREYRNVPHVVLKAVAISVVSQFSRILSVLITAKALGVAFTLEQSLVIVPSVIIVAMLPISLGGWGIREGLFVYLCGFIGIEAPAALSIGLLSHLVILAADVPGIAMYGYYGFGRSKKKVCAGKKNAMTLIPESNPAMESRWLGTVPGSISGVAESDTGSKTKEWQWP